MCVCVCVTGRKRGREKQRKCLGLLFGKGANPITGSSASPVSSAEFHISSVSSFLLLPLGFSFYFSVSLSPLQLEGKSRQISILQSMRLNRSPLSNNITGTSDPVNLQALSAWIKLRLGDMVKNKTPCRQY